LTGAGDSPAWCVLDGRGRPQRRVAAAPVEDYFHDMDGGVDLKTDGYQINPMLGRNTWLVWSGGNDRLWDRLTPIPLGPRPAEDRHLRSGQAGRSRR
jgi:hypothetical protein